MRSNSVNSSALACLTTPSQAAGNGGRCRDWTGATYGRIGYGQGTVQTTNATHGAAAAKAEVVRKSAAREGIRVRASVIPYSKPCHWGSLVTLIAVHSKVMLYRAVFSSVSKWGAKRCITALGDPSSNLAAIRVKAVSKRRTAQTI
jgi:hypothetical protein